jgi:uncharacterized OsmC-like protein
MSNVRYLTGEAVTYSSGTPGRALWSARQNHFVTDDLTDHGGPGEAATAIELFLGGVTACAVFMVERLAREAGLPLKRAEVKMSAIADRQAKRSGPPVLDQSAMHFELVGITEQDAAKLVETFKNR